MFTTDDELKEHQNIYTGKKKHFQGIVQGAEEQAMRELNLILIFSFFVVFH